MRFKIGNKVEVMNNKEALISWRCAELISSSGHTYGVRYDSCSTKTKDEVVERVSRKAIRPTPPKVEGVDSWVSGDIVEVFDEKAWKTATVLKVYGGIYYLVRVVGFSQEFRVHKFNIRTRQSWQNNLWIVIGKGSGKATCHQKNRFQTEHPNAKKNPRKEVKSLKIQNNNAMQESHMVSCKTLKRPSPYCSSLLEANTGNFRKARLIEDEGRIRRVGPTPLLQKVSNGYFEQERKKVIPRILERNDCDSDDDCSVGSCSIVSRNPTNFSTHFVPVSCENRDNLFCDYDYDEEESCSVPREEVNIQSIHNLELHAYRCTLVALYASGPLSWEKEALLTNLRISLNISNDEHLMELRNLISAR
jgi:hypothetical protein